MDSDRMQAGFGAKDGKVYAFEKDAIVVARVWPGPLAWSKKPGTNSWQHCRPRLNLEFPSLGRELGSENLLWNSLAPRGEPRRWALPDPLPDPERVRNWMLVRDRQLRKVRQAFEVIPAEVRHAVSSFRMRQWHLLAMVSACPDSLDLIHANPALAFAMASNWVFRAPAVRRPMAAVRRWVPKRQRHIGGWLGFPETESAVRLLRKLPVESCGVLPLLALRWMMRHDHRVAELRHLPRLQAPVLVALCRRRMSERIAPRLLREIAIRCYGPNDICPLRLLSDTLHMAHRLPEFPLPQAFHSIGAIREAHDRFAGLFIRYCRRGGSRFAAHMQIQFPEQPLEGDSRIIPLTSPEEAFICIG